MDYAKSKHCILWIHSWQGECQRSVNDSYLRILDYLGGDRLNIVIYEVLAFFTGNKEAETLPAPL
jgi:hypothetical protein